MQLLPFPPQKLPHLSPVISSPPVCIHSDNQQYRAQKLKMKTFSKILPSAMISSKHLGHL